MPWVCSGSIRSIGWIMSDTKQLLKWRVVQTHVSLSNFESRKRVLTTSRYRILGACQAPNPGPSPSVPGIKSVLRNKTIVIVILSLSKPPLKVDEFHWFSFSSPTNSPLYLASLSLPWWRDEHLCFFNLPAIDSIFFLYSCYSSSCV